MKVLVSCFVMVITMMFPMLYALVTLNSGEVANFINDFYGAFDTSRWGYMQHCYLFCMIGTALLFGLGIACTSTKIPTPTKKHIAHRAEEIGKISKALSDAQMVEALTEEVEALTAAHNTELEEKNKELEAVKTERDKLKQELVKLNEEWVGERPKIFFFDTPERRQEVEDWFAANPNIEISRPPLQTSVGDNSHIRTHLTLFYKKKPKPEPYPMDMATA